MQNEIILDGIYIKWRYFRLWYQKYFLIFISELENHSVYELAGAEHLLVSGRLDHDLAHRILVSITLLWWNVFLLFGGKDIFTCYWAWCSSCSSWNKHKLGASANHICSFDEYGRGGMSWKWKVQALVTNK